MFNSIDDNLLILERDVGATILTYQSMFIRYIVGELEFMEGDDLLHPLLPGGGAVRVDVHPLRHLGVRLPGHYPSAEIFCIYLTNKTLKIKWNIIDLIIIMNSNGYILYCTIHYFMLLRHVLITHLLANYSFFIYVYQIVRSAMFKSNTALFTVSVEI